VAKEVELTTNYDDILHDAEIKIVVELMGGLHPAKEYISDALNAGKNVVTANKDLMATFGSELIALATKNKCDLMYDASVAGGYSLFCVLLAPLMLVTRFQKFRESSTVQRITFCRG
jgi:homoserine dehydrogenase